MKKIILALFFFLCATRAVFADDKFSNSLYPTYEISSSGLATVTEETVITNKTSDFYPTEQTFIYHALNLGNLKVLDDQGSFEPEIEKKDSTTRVKVKFRAPVAGINKQTRFKLQYQTADLASLQGEVWQILIPGINNLDLYDDFRLTLLIPPEFPEIQYVSVTPKMRWVWDKSEMKDKGLVLIFGKNQYYELQLDYSLKNTGLAPVLDSLTIPPDTNYQKVILKSISESPDYSEEDADGNWIFWFTVKAQETKKIRVQMLTQVFFDPQLQTKLTPSQSKLWTKEQNFWDYKSISQGFTTPREIYDFTVKTLEYNLNRLNKSPERFRASEALKNPTNSICTDFTNVFIALARKNGIPAREVDGYAEAQNQDLQPLSLEKDILHAWPEYYDTQKSTWVMVDPTWEKTTGGISYFDKLDLNHITFIIKGASSEFPFPPGSFRTDELGGRDVKVDFAKKNDWDRLENLSQNSRKIDLIYEINDRYISGLTTGGKIVVQNKSATAIENLPLVFTVGDQKFNHSLTRLIPFQVYEFKFNLPKTKFWENRKISLVTTVNHKSFKKLVSFTPIYFWGNNIWWFAAGGVVIIFSVLFLFYTIIASKLRKTK